MSVEKVNAAFKNCCWLLSKRVRSCFFHSKSRCSIRQQRDWKSSMSRELRDFFFLGHFQKWSWDSLVAALTTTISKLEWYYLSFFILKCTFKRLTVLSIKKNLIGQFLVCSKNLWYWNSWGIIKFDFSECTMLCGGMIWIITKKSKEKTFFRKKNYIIILHIFCFKLGQYGRRRRGMLYIWKH